MLGPCRIWPRRKIQSRDAHRHSIRIAPDDFPSAAQNRILPTFDRPTDLRPLRPKSDPLEAVSGAPHAPPVFGSTSPFFIIFWDFVFATP